MCANAKVNKYSQVYLYKDILFTMRESTLERKCLKKAKW